MKKLLCDIFITLFVAILFLSCSSLKKERSMQELYNEAYSLYKEKSYYRAKTKFEKIIQRDPLNKFAVLSELHLADILYEKKDFDESIMHYEEYLRLNPKAKEYEYIQYKIGMSHFNMILSYDRDQTETRLASGKFEEYIKQFPDGEYRDEVLKNMDIALMTELKSEYNVGMFYYQMKKYDSAATRFENIIIKYSDGEFLHESYLVLAKSYNKLFNINKLRGLYNKYVTSYPKGRYKKDIYKFLEEQS